MGNNLSSLLAYRTTLYEAPSVPPQPAEPDSPEPLEITVLFTGPTLKNVQHALGALKKGGQLAQGLHARIRLLVPQVVPYSLPLTSPPVMLEFTERRFRVIAAEQATNMRVEIFLCRDIDEMLDQALKPKSMIVIGGAKRFWSTSEERLARRLRRKGHDVIFVSSSHKENMKEEQVYA